MIRENLNTIQNRIEEACENSGRVADSVILIAVSKTRQYFNNVSFISVKISFYECY
jgi:uncharacterized pyridoxal phosphate-containing UPF0001 family protein